MGAVHSGAISDLAVHSRRMTVDSVLRHVYCVVASGPVERAWPEKLAASPCLATHIERHFYNESTVQDTEEEISAEGDVQVWADRARNRPPRGGAADFARSITVPLRICWAPRMRLIPRARAGPLVRIRIRVSEGAPWRSRCGQ